MPHDRRHDDDEEDQAARGDPGEAPPQLGGAGADRVVRGVDLEQGDLAVGRPDRAVDLDGPLAALERVLRLVQVRDVGDGRGLGQRRPLFVAQREGAPDELALVGVEHLPVGAPQLDPHDAVAEQLVAGHPVEGGDGGRVTGEQPVGERGFDDRLGQHAGHRRRVVDGLALGELPRREGAQHPHDDQGRDDAHGEQHEHPARAQHRFGAARPARLAQRHPAGGDGAVGIGRPSAVDSGAAGPSSSSASTETSPAAAGAVGDPSGVAGSVVGSVATRVVPALVVVRVAAVVVGGVVGVVVRAVAGGVVGRCCRRSRVRTSRSRRRHGVVGAGARAVVAGARPVAAVVVARLVVGTPSGRSPPWSSPGSSSETPSGRSPPWSSTLGVGEGLGVRVVVGLGGTGGGRGARRRRHRQALGEGGVAEQADDGRHGDDDSGDEGDQETAHGVSFRGEVSQRGSDAGKTHAGRRRADTPWVPAMDSRHRPLVLVPPAARRRHSCGLTSAEPPGARPRRGRSA